MAMCKCDRPNALTALYGHRSRMGRSDRNVDHLISGIPLAEARPRRRA
ncbi:hypothetical protein L479_03252 [Exiguobacterium sp. S17]|nr:hypothetical protein L479_03252 [Exiguobacterium sp. S17]